MSVQSLPVTQSIREISRDAWIIGNRTLLSRQRTPSSECCWSDGTSSFYVLSDVSYPLPPSRSLPATSRIKMVHDAGGVSAVWSMGDAFCKVKILDPGATREHVTLDYLHLKGPLSFTIPHVHYHAEYDGRYYIALSRLAGQTLVKAWGNMDKAMKQHYVSRVANICKELAVWQADKISGVDGQYLSDHFLTRVVMPNDCCPQNMLSNCKELGMDCSIFYFYHCDLGPGNIIVNLEEGSLGIIDWETAGFVPAEWIRTKFCVASGMDLPGGDEDSRVDWRRRVQRQLGKKGFLEIAEQWIAWWSNKD